MAPESTAAPISRCPAERRKSEIVGAAAVARGRVAVGLVGFVSHRMF